MLDSTQGRKSATDAQAGRAADSQSAVSDGIRVQNWSNPNENPGGGVPTIARPFEREEASLPGPAPTYRQERAGNDGIGDKEDIIWAKIVSIKIFEPQQVYDLAIEGTHNFIANDIIAHNTFVTGFVNFTNNTAFNQTLYLVNGNVGIGTTSPQNRLEVIGAVTFAGGVNASSLNVTGFSITDDSLVTLSDLSKKKIKDIKEGEEVLTLDEKTSKLVPRKVNALLDHGVKPIYEMSTETGKAINTTGEHPYLVKLYREL